MLLVSEQHDHGRPCSHLSSVPRRERPVRGRPGPTVTDDESSADQHRSRPRAPGAPAARAALGAGVQAHRRHGVSDDPRLLDPLWVVQTLKATKPKLYADLLAATAPPYRGGDRRMPGDWAPGYLAFVLSGHVDVQPFYATHLCSPIWRLAGFEYDGDGGPDVPGFPSYETVRLRFAELEAPRYVNAFLIAAQELIQLAVKADPRVGRHVQADGTGYHAHSLIEHACPPNSRCGADEARRAG
jgi:hypothetical protein